MIVVCSVLYGPIGHPVSSSKYHSGFGMNGGSVVLVWNIRTFLWWVSVWLFLGCFFILGFGGLW